MLRATRLRMALHRKRQEILALRCRAAIMIQCAWRSHQGVNALRVLKQEFLKHRELQRLSAQRIKGTFKTILFRKAIRLRIQQTRKRLCSTVSIQKWYRAQLRRQAEQARAK